MTAEELTRKYMRGDGAVEIKHVTKLLKDFAKLHVEAALKAASESREVDLFVRPNRKGTKYKKIEPGESYDIFGTRQMWKPNKDAILNSYPLEKIQ